MLLDILYVRLRKCLLFIYKRILFLFAWHGEGLLRLQVGKRASACGAQP